MKPMTANPLWFMQKLLTPIFALLVFTASSVANAVPMSLKDIPVQEPPNLPAFLKPLLDANGEPILDINGNVQLDPAAKAAVIRLGKALFWDMRLGTDNLSACATCHFNAGADPRSKNQLEPGYLASRLSPTTVFDTSTQMPQPPTTRVDDLAFGNSVVPGVPGPNVAPWRFGFAPNFQLNTRHYPFHRRTNPTAPGDGFNNRNVTMDTNDITSSQGVRAAFENPVVINGQTLEPRDVVFNVNGQNTRRVPSRNTPSAFNGGFKVDQFWDGRASHVFNGANPFGFRDTVTRIERTNEEGDIELVYVRIPFFAHASQAVGPPTSTVELSGHSRNFQDLAIKFLRRPEMPLALQAVHATDSVFGQNNVFNLPSIVQTQPQIVTTTSVVRGRTVTTRTQVPPRGLTQSYINLIQEAFRPEWISTDLSTKNIAGGDLNVMEMNFPLIFGIATAMYQNTLISDDTPYDRFFGVGNDCLPVIDPVTGLAIIDPAQVRTLCTPLAPELFVPVRNNLVQQPVNPAAMTAQEQRGFLLFQSSGCINCHSLPETSNATQRLAGLQPANPLTNGEIRDPNTGLIRETDPLTGLVLNDPFNPVAIVAPTTMLELMPMGNLQPGVYDLGFYNLGVRPTEEDIGRGNSAPPNAGETTFTRGFPLSFTELALMKHLGDTGNGPALPPGVREYVPDTGLIEVIQGGIVVGEVIAPIAEIFDQAGNRVVTRGAFKTPQLRNGEYQGPYFHNGGDATLRHVVEFYARGGNFPGTNFDHLDADMAPIPALDPNNGTGLNPTRAQQTLALQNVQALVAFMANGLTDQRVVRSMAPFDHPELKVPVGQNRTTRVPDTIVTWPATGAAGSNAITSRFLGLSPQVR
jgi:cytochrome c peroxidase